MTSSGIGGVACGMPVHITPRRLDASGPGHGLGLAFCQRVVQAAQGTIRVKSAPLKGAVFSIELPVA